MKGFKKKRRCVCVFVLYQMSISQKFHVMGVQTCFVMCCAYVCHKINNKSEISQFFFFFYVEKYFRSYRSIAIHFVLKTLKDIPEKHFQI